MIYEKRTIMFHNYVPSFWVRPGCKIHRSRKFVINIDQRLSSLLQVILVVIFVTMAASSTLTERRADGGDDVETIYAVVLDAGSTGTSINLFQYNLHRNENGGISDLELIDSLADRIRPGLSAYGDHPEMAVVGLKSLIQMALKFVPKERRAFTPLILRATAGLRLMNGDEAEQILTTIDKHLRSMDTPFKMLPDSVSIMNGEDEGVYAWLSVNYLLGRLNSDDSSVALDLGGGSTQITFDPQNFHTFYHAPPETIVERNILAKQRHLYSSSYLGFGLKSARKAILSKGILREIVKTEKKIDTKNKRIIHVKHPCFPLNSRVFWKFDDVSYIIEGDARGDCLEMAQQFILENENGISVHSPGEINQRQVNALSYFYDRAVQFGLIDGYRGFSSIHVKDYYLAAKSICGFDLNRTSEVKRDKQYLVSNESVLTSQGFVGSCLVTKERAEVVNVYGRSAFACLDLSYIYSLLNTGFGLNADRKIWLFKHMKHVTGPISVSWALGATIDLIYKLFSLKS